MELSVDSSERLSSDLNRYATQYSLSNDAIQVTLSSLMLKPKILHVQPTCDHSSPPDHQTLPPTSAWLQACRYQNPRRQRLPPPGPLCRSVLQALLRRSD